MVYLLNVFAVVFDSFVFGNLIFYDTFASTILLGQGKCLKETFY